MIPSLADWMRVLFGFPSPPDPPSGSDAAPVEPATAGPAPGAAEAWQKVEAFEAAHPSLTRRYG